MIWIVLGLFVVLFLLFKTDIAEAILLGMFSLTLTVYACYCVNINNSAIMIGVIVAIMILCIYWYKNKGNFYKRVISEVCSKKNFMLLIALVLLLVADIIALSHFRPLYDAEFNYYVSSIKYFFLTNSFGTNDTVVFDVFGSYTPINGLIISLVMKAFGGWNESIIYISNCFLCQLCFFPFLSNGSKKTIFIRLMVVFTLPFLMLEDFFEGITPECMETALFFWCLFTIWNRNEDDKWFTDIKIVIGLSILILVKSPTILMVVVCYLIVLILDIKNKVSFSKKHILYIVPIIMLLLWKIYCRMNHLVALLHIGSKNALDFEYIISMIEERKFVFGEYIKMFCKETLNGGVISVTGLIGLIICILPFLVIRNKDKIRKYKIFYLCSMAGMACYCIGHLYLYLFVFSTPETQIMSAFVRYICGYLPACIFFAIYVMYEEKKIAINCMLVLAWIGVLNWANLYHNFEESNYRLTHEEMHFYADAVSEKFDAFDVTFEEGDKICIFFNEQYYLIRQNLKYLSIPAKSYFVQIKDENYRDTEEYLGHYDYYFWVKTSDDGMTLDDIVLLEKEE